MGPPRRSRRPRQPLSPPWRPHPPPAASRRLSPRPPRSGAGRASLSAQIARTKRYPQKAMARHEEGLVRVSFTIDRNSRVLDSRVLESSGSADLDQELLAMVTRAQPLPKPPPAAKAADLTFTVGTRFSLR